MELTARCGGGGCAVYRNEERKNEMETERERQGEILCVCVSRTELSPKFIKTVNEIKRFNYTINLAVVIVCSRVASH